jgi:hypothetical protein
VLARRTATDNDDVVSVAHDGSGLPACSRIMYSAYQLGQSASSLTGPLFMLAVRGLRTPERARELGWRGECCDLCIYASR